MEKDGECPLSEEERTALRAKIDAALIGETELDSSYKDETKTSPTEKEKEAGVKKSSPKPGISDRAKKAIGDATRNWNGNKDNQPIGTMPGGVNAHGGDFSEALK